MRARFLFTAQPFNSRCLLFECVSVILLAAVFWLCCLGSASPCHFTTSSLGWQHRRIHSGYTRDNMFNDGAHSRLLHYVRIC